MVSDGKDSRWGINIMRTRHYGTLYDRHLYFWFTYSFFNQSAMTCSDMRNDWLRPNAFYAR
jgi:hypothetical protein